LIWALATAVSQPAPTLQQILRISVGRFPSDGPAFGSPSLIPLR